MTNFYATLNGTEFTTKKALREAVANGEPVNFEDVGYPFARGSCYASELRPADVVLGPNPWHARDWQATIENGKVM